MDLVVSEVVANVAVHGGGGEIALSVGHAEGRLLVVWHLTEEFTYRPEDDRSVTAWAVPGCVCGEVR